LDISEREPSALRAISATDADICSTAAATREMLDVDCSVAADTVAMFAESSSEAEAIVAAWRAFRTASPSAAPVASSRDREASERERASPPNRLSRALRPSREASRDRPMSPISWRPETPYLSRRSRLANRSSSFRALSNGFTIEASTVRDSTPPANSPATSKAI
jgi:hypothetical protein